MPTQFQPNSSRALDTSPDEFAAACEKDMEQAKALLAKLKSARAGDASATLTLFDEAMGLLQDAMSRCSLCRNVHPAPAMRDSAEKCEQALDALLTETSLDKDIYQALSALDSSQFDPATRHYWERTLRDFRRAGVDKDDATRKRVKQLRDELLRIGQEFGNNIKDDVRQVSLEPSDLDGLPEDFKKAHPPGADGKVTLTTDNTDYVPFVTYAKSSSARESLWRLYRLRGHPKNLDVLSKMLTKRAELARILGYPSWAAYATEDKMIGSAEKASEFIAKISALSESRAQNEYAQLLVRKKADAASASHVQPWDSAFYQERIKAETYGFEAQKARPYFDYRRVKQGILDVTAKLFGITYKPVPDAPRWHEDVDTYDVYKANTAIGRIQLDMHPREGKYKHYAQFTLVNGVEGRRLPVGVLVCNFPRPKADAPALLELSDVRTFLHEFGHLLHHVFGGHTRWAGISGVATEWDFVEAPSQMLEEWIWDVPTMQSFARHHQTEEPIPEELLKKAKAASEYGKGLGVRQQMFYAALSLEYHLRNPEGLDTTALLAQLQARYIPFPHIEGTYFQESFGHLDGYSAIYYTYMWSLVIAKDMFSEFQRLGLNKPEVAERYRDRVLAPGGSKPAAELVSDFLGRPYSFAAYESWLNG